MTQRLSDILTDQEQAELLAESEQGRDPETVTPIPVLVRLADVAPVEVDWLWKPYIPGGKLTILEGDPGLGKTWLALALAAIVTRGWPFPGQDGIPEQAREPANVLYLSAEDGLADTLRPRLDKAGADVSRVFVLTGQQNGGEMPEAVTLADVGVLRSALVAVKPALLIIDPLQAYLGAGVDMHRANEVRPVLAKLAGLAEEFNCAVLCIRHLGKGQQDRAIYRGLGSIDFAAAARSILLVGQDPENPQARAVVHIKSSLAAAGPSLGYTIGPDGFQWTGVSELTAAEILKPEQATEEKSALEEAEAFLLDLLAAGPVDSKTVFKEARRLGIAERTLKRAKAKAGIKSQKIGNTWVFRLGHGGQHGTDERESPRAIHGTLDTLPSSPIMAQDSGHELRRPHGLLDLEPSSPTESRPEANSAKGAKGMFLGEKVKEGHIDPGWEGDAGDLPF